MNITATKRQIVSKGEMKKRLRQGYVPGAVYGRGMEPFLVEVPAKAIATALLAESGANTILEMTVADDSKTHTVLIDQLERHPVTRDFIHVGFHQMKKGDKVTVQIPVQLIGEPVSVTRNEALLEQMLETIQVHALPADLPPHLDIDVSKMQPGDIIRVADLPHNSKLTFTAAEDQAIASLHASHPADAAAETTAAAAPAAP